MVSRDLEHAPGRRVEQRGKWGRKTTGKRQEEDGTSDFHGCLKPIRIQKFVRFELGIDFMKNPQRHLFEKGSVYYGKCLRPFR